MITPVKNETTTPLHSIIFENVIPSCLRIARFGFVLFVLSSSTIIVRGVEPAKPKITAVFPSTAYPAENGRYNLTVFGDHFGDTTNGLFLEISNEGRVQQLKWEDTPPKGLPAQAQAQLVSDRQINVWGLPHTNYFRNLKLRVETSAGLSESFDIRLSEFSRWTPLVLASLISAVILCVPLILCCSRSHMIDGVPYKALKTFLIDPETDTYSLSKFQFFLWTIVAIFGYAYLTMVRTLVQGVFEFADIPQGLPGIIFASAATTILAQGVTSARGAKGAGPVQPSLCDLITTGGVVAAERFQFLVWTLLGVSAFFFLIVWRDPSDLQDLPKIPQQFLYLMGISSAGYLGGKLVRKPGPIIDDIAVQTAPAPRLVLTLKGRKLSKAAYFKIDGLDVELGKHQPHIQALPADADEQAATPDSFKSLQLGVDQPESAWTTAGTHRLLITNPDGQSAEWPFKV